MNDSHGNNGYSPGSRTSIVSGSIAVALLFALTACGDSSTTGGDGGSGDSDGGSGKNRPPVSNAGNDLSVITDSLVNLSGNSSYDPDGDSLNYRWERQAGTC